LENAAFQQLLKKYRLGECTEIERQFVEEWYSNLNTEGVVEFQDINSTKQKLWGKISEQIDRKESQSVIVGDAWKLLKSSFIRKIAAIIVIGLVYLGAQLHQFSKRVTSLEIVKNQEFSTIYLTDGSTVKLKSDSYMKYPEEFTGNTREVNLIGEAFFEIARDSLRPFIIHSPNIRTKVLGTSFSIRAYEGGKSQEVEVVSGRVLVTVKQQSGKNREIVLKPSQKMIYTQKLDSLIAINTADYSPIVQGISKTLAFVEVPLHEIIARLSDLYNTKIILGNSTLKNCLITADLNEEPLEICLEILAKSLNATYIINDQFIEINGPGC
jgi:transmembrane sensor